MCSIKSMTIDTSTFSTRQIEDLMSYLSELESVARYQNLKDTDTSPKLTSNEAHDDMIRAVLDAPELPPPVEETEEARLFAQHEALVDKFKENFSKQFRITSQILREKHGCDHFQELVEDLRKLADGVLYNELNDYPDRQEQMIFRILSEL